ncbi:MAG: DUF5615 family PIN-like protein [Methanophagales archaeon]|nr:DUF5615 family PIN-like protein [Methanophagales archaeon]
MSTNFPEEVLELVKQIPRGKITTYGELSRALTGSVRAARAVGQAVARNPYPIQIPCHRVVRSTGDVGGYRLGVDTKIRLLSEEGIELKGRKVVKFEETLFKKSQFPNPKENAKMTMREKNGEKELRFVTDRMLGKLSTWLRILGHDTIYAGDITSEKGVEDEDTAIITFAAQEARIILTRDKKLASLADKKGVRCLYLQSDEVMGQLKELQHQSIAINREPRAVRCSECNARLRKVEKGEEDMLREKSYVPTSLIGTWDFWICERCGRVYWEGSHWRDMRERLRQLK